MSYTLPTRTPKKRLLSDINVTPFVDVMLVLLIIFMITAPFIEHGISVQLPETSSSTIQPKEKTLTLKIFQSQEIYLEKSKFSLENLTSEMEKTYKDRRNKEIFVHADARLSYGYVAKVISALQKAGIDKIGLVTTPLKK
ncbi:MAG TPA: protein TolR [Bdellovibrionota bacterium]|nr:protein TolR [Bdellovibrionota bacterium]